MFNDQGWGTELKIPLVGCFVVLPSLSITNDVEFQRITGWIQHGLELEPTLNNVERGLEQVLRIVS